MITSILEYLESSASRYPDKTAFADLDATCTEKSGAGFYGKKCGYHRYVYGGCLCWMFLCAS